MTVEAEPRAAMPDVILRAALAAEARRLAEQSEAPAPAPVTPSPRGKRRDPGNGKDILSALSNFFSAGGFGTLDQLAHALSRRRGAIKFALNTLVQEGVVVPEIQRPKIGRPKTVFRPATWREMCSQTGGKE